MQQKQIDILLVTYNQEKYIQQALDGIFMQRLNNDWKMRIIVADDCSTDGTLDSIKTYSLKHDAKWMFLPSDTNVGHVRNYQRAFAACRGDHVAIIEGDDYWTDPLHIQHHIDFFESHRECVLTTQRPIWYYDEEQRFEQREDITLSGEEYKAISLVDELRDNQITNLSSCVIRGTALRGLDKKVFSGTILDWPMYIDLYRYGALYELCGTSSVYRAKSSGFYAGLNDEEQRQARLRYLSELEEIFPRYKEYFVASKRVLQSYCKKKTPLKVITEWLLRPLIKCNQIRKRILKAYKQ